MKGLIYMVLMLVFIMFFNTNPLIALVVLGCIFGVFLFMRRRKSNSSGNLSSRLLDFGKGPSQQHSSLNTFLTLMMFQQINTSEEDTSQPNYKTIKKHTRIKEIERQKQEILRLLKNGEDL